MEGKNGAFMAVSHNDNDFVGMLHGMFESPCLLSVLHLAAKSLKLYDSRTGPILLFCSTFISIICQFYVSMLRP